MREHSDIVVAGGGPVGAAFALALADSEFSVQVLEARTHLRQPAFRRTLALSYGTRLILERLGVWSALRKVTPIRDIHISQRGGIGVARLSAGEEQLPELGAVVDYGELDAVLHQVLANSPVQVVSGARVVDSFGTATYASLQVEHHDQPECVTTRMAVIADGGAGLARRAHRAYAQHALVAWVKSELPHEHCAYERFTDEGPMALLPDQDGFALVLTALPERVNALLAMPEADFLAELYSHFGGRLGHFVQVRERNSFPLAASYARDVVSAHRVMIGNAAHMMHPVAGQGFNLGLRDAWELAGQVRACGREALGSLPMLKRYAATRQFDVSASMWFTDSLVRLFTQPDPLLGHVRSMGLLALQQLPPLKHFVARRMIFGARAW
jgi:2-octaprenyl-6-methoxyphenol hydroxylase